MRTPTTLARATLTALLLGGIALAFGTLSVVATRAIAQPPADEPDEPAEPPPPPPPQPPIYRGRDRATGQAGNVLGATYELASGAKLVLPGGNRISSAQTFNFSTSRTPLRPADVATGFVRQGVVLAFDGQIDASRAPVELSIRQRTLTARPNMKLVLAMEVAGICNATHTLRLAGPLCSHWRTLDARHDPATGRIVIQLPAPGGYRLVFGWIPDAQPALVDPANL